MKTSDTRTSDMKSLIHYTKSEGGMWHHLVVHSVRLPNGDIYDSALDGYRPDGAKKPPGEVRSIDTKKGA